MSKLLFALKQKVSLADKTVDPEFETERKKLLDMHKQTEALTSSIAKQEEALRNFVEALRVMCDSAGGATARSGATLDRVAATISGPMAQCTERTKILHQEIKAFHSRVHTCKQKIGERDSSLADCDRFADALKKLQGKPGSESQIPATEAKLGAAKQSYETINHWLMTEISALIQEKTTVIDTKVAEVLAIYAKLFSTLGIAFTPWSDDVTAAAAAAAVTTTPVTTASTAPPRIPPKPHATAVTATTATAQPPPRPTPVPPPKPAAAARHSQMADADAPPLPPKHHRAAPAAPQGVEDAAAEALVTGDTDELERALGRAGGDAVAAAALDEENQQRVGAAVASAATDEETQQHLGAAIAETSDNPFVQAFATSSVVQRGVGSAVGAAATNKTVQQKAGQCVAQQAQSEENQRRVTGGIRQGVQGAFSASRR